VRKSLTAVLISLSMVQPGEAQQDFGGLRYRNIGPHRGGRVTAVAGHMAQPSTYYMGATGGGVWKTESHGNLWTNVSDGYFATGSIGAIDVANTDPNIVYVGTGSAAIRSNVITGKGVYRSGDGGDSWTFAGLLESGQIAALEIDPRNPDVVFVAAVGNAFAPNTERGVFRTRDGGRTWDKHRCVGRQDQPGQSGRGVGGNVAGRTQAVDDHQRRTRRWCVPLS
jgi:hypothetical protein